jgi:NAD(P)-dependent dehydrogenase (short-subunit alcohol dehydrogenase family)
MLAYGVSKAAVVHTARSLAQGGLPSKAKSIVIAPYVTSSIRLFALNSHFDPTSLSELSETIDTPTNRAAMPDTDTSSWTPPAFIAERLFAWSSGDEQVENGSLLAIQTRKGETAIKTLRLQVDEL